MKIGKLACAVLVSVAHCSLVGRLQGRNGGGSLPDATTDEWAGCVMFHAQHKSGGVTVMTTLRESRPPFKNKEVHTRGVVLGCSSFCC